MMVCQNNNSDVLLFTPSPYLTKEDVVCIFYLSPDILQGYDAIEKKNDTLSAQLEALADMKFTHVVSCQIYGSQKNSGDPQAKDILDLMIRCFFSMKLRSGYYCT